MLQAISPRPPSVRKTEARTPQLEQPQLEHDPVQLQEEQLQGDMSIVGLIDLVCFGSVDGRRACQDGAVVVFGRLMSMSMNFANGMSMQVPLYLSQSPIVTYQPNQIHVTRTPPSPSQHRHGNESHRMPCFYGGQSAISLRPAYA